MDKEMAMVNSSTKTEVTTKVSGKTIKWMVGANFSMKEENSLIREIGVKMNFMDSEKFTMTTRLGFNVVSILLISTFLRTTGSIMKGCL